MDTPQPMPRLKLHRSTWVVGGIVLLLSILVLVPGFAEDVFVWNGIVPTGGTPVEYEHGWPYVFLNRGYYSFGEPPLGVPWMSWNAWKLWQSNHGYEFSLPYLVVDMIIMAGIVVSLTAVWECRRRRRTRALQLRITDLLVLTLLFSIVLTWHSYHRNLERSEEAVSRELNEIDKRAFHTYSEKNVKLGWLERLLGNRLVPRYRFITHLNYDQQASTGTIVTALPLLKDLGYLEHLSIELAGKREPALFTSVAELSSIRTVTIYGDDKNAVIDMETAEDIALMQQIVELRIRLGNRVPAAAKQLLRERLPNRSVEFSDEE